MNNTSLPTEILAIIIEAFVSECADSNRIKFIPRWYLIPLLQVSKLWNTLCTTHMYRSMEIGNASPFVFPAREGESPIETEDRRQLYITRYQITRRGLEVAKELYGTLSTNSRLAVLVERLQFGMDKVRHYYGKSKWTEMKIGILKICPDVRHVEVYGFEIADLDSLVNVLKEKSLVSFYITPRRIADIYQLSTGPRKGGSSFQIFDMMQRWPRLQRIRVEGFITELSMANPLTLDMSEVAGRCPDLREIVITGTALRPSELKLLRTMCTGGVTTLSITTHSGSDFIDELSECFRAWSSTLRFLKVDDLGLDSRSPALDEAIGTLTELRELQVESRWVLHSGTISRLPWLERYACIVHGSGEQLQSFMSHLEHSESYPSLNHIVLNYNIHEQYPNELQDICSRRNILLHVVDINDTLPADFGLTPLHYSLRIP